MTLGNRVLESWSSCDFVWKSLGPGSCMGYNRPTQTSGNQDLWCSEGLNTRSITSRSRNIPNCGNFCRKKMPNHKGFSNLMWCSLPCFTSTRSAATSVWTTKKSIAARKPTAAQYQVRVLESLCHSHHCYLLFYGRQTQRDTQCARDWQLATSPPGG